MSMPVVIGILSRMTDYQFEETVIDKRWIKSNMRLSMDLDAKIYKEQFCNELDAILKGKNLNIRRIHTMPVRFEAEAASGDDGPCMRMYVSVSYLVQQLNPLNRRAARSQSVITSEGDFSATDSRSRALTMPTTFFLAPLPPSESVAGLSVGDVLNSSTSSTSSTLGGSGDGVGTPSPSGNHRPS